MNHEEKLTVARNYLGAFASENAILEGAHLLREEAVQALPALICEFDQSELPLDLLSTAYMLSSYASHEDHHALKKPVIEFFKRELDEWGVLDGAATPPHRKRPRIVIAATFMKSGHTMFRVYGKAIAELKKRFEVIGLIFTDSMDAAAAQVFDRVIIAQAQAAPFFDQVKRITEIVRDLAPDALIYADNAMHPFGVALSSLRLAPLQILWAGHPASSYSPTMDYFMIEDAFAHGLADFTESRALVATNRNAFTPLPELSTPRADREPGPLRILVPGVTIKLTHPFLKTVAHIMRELPAAELHITTNARPEKDFEFVQACIQTIVPGAMIYPRLSYDFYLRLVDNCDMFLNPYPFGGCSTVMDCVTRGLPGVSMTGRECFSLQGPIVMKRCGLPEFSTIATTEREYIGRAINLAINNPLRRAYTEQLRRTAPDQFPVFTDRADGYATALSLLLERNPAHGPLQRPHYHHAVHAH